MGSALLLNFLPTMLEKGARTFSRRKKKNSEMWFGQGGKESTDVSAEACATFASTSQEGEKCAAHGPRRGKRKRKTRAQPIGKGGEEGEGASVTSLRILSFGKIFIK